MKRRVKIKLIGKIFTAETAELSYHREINEYTCLSSGTMARAVGCVGGCDYKLDIEFYVEKAKDVRKIEKKYFEELKGRMFRFAYMENGNVTDVIIPNSYLISMSISIHLDDRMSVRLTIEGREKPIFLPKIKWGF